LLLLFIGDPIQLQNEFNEKKNSNPSCLFGFARVNVLGVGFFFVFASIFF